MKEGVFKCFFFFQAEDGIRDYKVTGVQTCALPISAPVAPALSGGGDAQVQKMGFARGKQEHRVTDQLSAVAVCKAAVPGAQRVAEIPDRPGKFIEALLDLDHRAKIGLAHRLEARGRSQYRAHQRSLVLSATLSRRYSGTAAAASFASPAAKRGIASFSTARAVAAASGRIAETHSPSRAARSSR